MWEWILMFVLLAALVYMFVTRSSPPPGCKACAKRKENPDG
uniref:FeoB-associated Cys-rich membrane protein n=1 Tax=viral metagenome TaxID=1070528 RepID=A0A6C0AJM3_9ZZZZ